MNSVSDPKDDVQRKFSRGAAAEKWAAMYDHDTQMLEEHNFRVRRQLTVAHVMKVCGPASKVLDLGCGSAPVLSLLRQRGIDCVGIDYSDDMLELGRERLRAMSLDDSGLSQGDARDLPFPDASFDSIVCLGMISYVENYAQVLQEINRLLKPGGTVIISFRNRWNPLLSDPVQLARLCLRKLLRRPAPAYKPGQFMSHLEVTRELDQLRLEFVQFHGVGFGPFCIGERSLFGEATSIRISEGLTKLFTGLHLAPAFKWLTDVSLWVYRKPVGPPAVAVAVAITS